jgi:hypothetical protein
MDDELLRIGSPVWISGLVFRAVDADWEPRLPSESHPTFKAFNNLRVQWLAQEHASQKDLLDKRLLP